MTALQLIQGLADVIFVLLFVVGVRHAIEQRSRASVDIALFFGALAVAVLQRPLTSVLGVETPPLVSTLFTIVVMALPFLMVQLLGDLTTVPLWVRTATLGGLIASIVLVVTLAQPMDPIATLFLIGYFAVVSLYAAAAFVRLARRSAGVTRRRTQAIAVGMGLFGLAVLVAAVSTIAPGLGGLVSGLTQLLALGAAIAWLLGFATPPQLRRYWQEPELRTFLQRAGTLPRLPTTAAILLELERGVGASFGARAAIGVYDGTRNTLRFREAVGLPAEMPADSGYLAWRVFRSQEPTFYPDAARANPQNAAGYRAAAVGPILIAPITAGERKIGVLEAFAAHRPVFSTEDLALLQLLADQAAVVLESRALIDEAARVQAQEEAARLKEDFVSAAAHDLKTPLTTLLGQAQILELRFGRDPALVQHQPAVARIAGEARRLSTLVEDLLDASRIEEGRLDIRREPVDLALVVRQVAERSRIGQERIVVDLPEELPGAFDRRRIEQLIDNLIENALKYSGEETPVEIRGRRDGGAAHLEVSDHGIGIPPADLDRVFDRLWRASNVDARRYAGIGLGLYICRGIVVEHGGRIWAESTLGQGSTFHVLLPAAGEGRLN